MDWKQILTSWALRARSCFSAATLPAVSKHTRDNLALIIALLAAALTGWQGYEARAARESADTAAKEMIKAAKETIELQREATDDQELAVRLDERPYITALPSEYIAPARSPGGLVFKSRLKLVVSGRMPAESINLGWTCEVYNFAKGPQKISPDVRTGKTRMEAKRVFYSLPSGEIPVLNDCGQEVAAINDLRVLVVGQVTFEYFFGKLPSAPFCYVGQFPDLLDSSGRSKIYNPVADWKELTFAQCADFDPKTEAEMSRAHP